MWTVASDIDGTLTGDRDALDRLAQRMARLRSAKALFLVLSTGRRLDQVISGVAEEGLPAPDAVLCQVGTEVYLSPITTDSEPLQAWRELLLQQFNREEAVAFFDGIEHAEMQPDRYNTELKVSYYLDSCNDPEGAADEIRRRVEPHDDRYQVVWSSGRDLDILPASSGKGKAIRFLVEHLGLPPDRVVVAGDTGNDATMLHEFDRGIVVGNAKPELIAVAESLGADRVYQARQDFAAGVEEGLEHFRILGNGADT